MYILARGLYHLSRVINPYYEETLHIPSVSLTWPYLVILLVMELSLRIFKSTRSSYFNSQIINNLRPTICWFINISFGLFVVMFWMIYINDKLDRLYGWRDLKDDNGVENWILAYWYFYQLYIYVSIVFLPQGSSFLSRIMWVAAFRHCLSLEVLFICSMDAVNTLLGLIQHQLPEKLVVRLKATHVLLTTLHSYVCLLTDTVYPSFWQSLAILSTFYLYPLTILDTIFGKWTTLILLTVIGIYNIVKKEPVVTSGYQNIQNRIVESVRQAGEERASRWQIDSQGQSSPTTSSTITNAVTTAIGTLSNAPASSSSNDLCVICLSNKRELAVRPCNHLCLCSQCVSHLQKYARENSASTYTKCPICSGDVQEVIRIYNV